MSKKRYSPKYETITIGSRFAWTAVEPTAEPVTLQEVKDYHRIDHNEDDTLISDVLIPAARKSIEKHLQASIIQQTKQVNLDSWIRRIALPCPVWQSVSQVQYYNTDSPETLTTLDSSLYRFDAHTGELHFSTSLPAAAYRGDAVQIQYISGEATATEALKTACLLTIGGMYENRESEVIGQGIVLIKNPAVKWLIDPYRSFR